MEAGGLAGAPADRAGPDTLGEQGSHAPRSKGVKPAGCPAITPALPPGPDCCKARRSGLQTHQDTERTTTPS